MTYLNIKEIIALTNKSESTIKRFIRETHKSGVESYREVEIFKYEPLPTGHKKTFVLEVFVHDMFLKDSIGQRPIAEPFKEPLRDLLDEPLVDTLKDTISFLQNQINNKDEQLKDYSDQFTAFQKIELQAMERLQEQNHIIHQLQIIGQERQRKLEQYQQGKQIAHANFDNVEEVPQVDEEVVDHKETEENISDSFTDWLRESQA